MCDVHKLSIIAQRTAIMGLLVETFETPADKRTFIRGMVEISAITAATGAILLEAYVPESA